MKWLLTALLLVSSASGQQIYDLLLKNGRVIDPANHRDGQMDVAVIGNKIFRVAPNLPVAHARVVVDLGGYLVTPGLIDVDMHLGELKPDYNTLPYGVTTAVDAGSATCATFANFKKEVIDHAKTRVLASIADAGCAQNPEVVPGPVTIISTTGPDAISSGMDSKNVLLRRVNMGTAMSIYLNLGMKVEQIIERTTANPARAIKRLQLGVLNEGGVADIAVLEIQQGDFGFLNSALTRVDASRRFHCVLTVRNGVVVWDSEGLSISDTTHAGPYTNFK